MDKQQERNQLVYGLGYLVNVKGSAIPRGVGVSRKVPSVRYTATETTTIVGISLVYQLGLKQPWFKGLRERGQGQIQWAIAIRSVGYFPFASGLAGSRMG